jgi:hypothetical protein
LEVLRLSIFVVCLGAALVAAFLARVIHRYISRKHTVKFVILVVLTFA